MPNAPGSDLSDGLLLDLYELTMAEAYFEHGMTAPAFVRAVRPPPAP